jgi:heme-degrading monooxygenase HmoA
MLAPSSPSFSTPIATKKEALSKKERVMQYARIAVYQIQASAIPIDEVIRRNQAGMLPIFRNQPGFVGYGIVKAGEDSVISISFWRSRQEADAAGQVAASWAKDNLAEVTFTAQNYVGDLSFFSSTGPIGS